MNWVKRHRIISSVIALPVVMFLSGAIAAEAGVIGILFLMLSILGLVIFVLNGRKPKEEKHSARTD